MNAKTEKKLGRCPECGRFVKTDAYGLRECSRSTWIPEAYTWEHD